MTYTIVGVILLFGVFWFITGSKNSYYIQARRIFDDYKAGLEIGQNIPFQIALDYAAVQYGKNHKWPAYGHQVAVTETLNRINSGRANKLGMSKLEMGVYMILETDLKIQ